jgi:DNA polymerase III alpha subunit
MAIIIGFAPEEAEQLRKIIGKKQKDEVKEWEKKIYDKCEQNGFDKDVGKSLWDIANASAKYQFNASHSLSYSYTTALTVYLKYKYPVHFYLSCLKHAGQAQNPIEEIRSIAGELSSFNIKLLGPHLTKSDMSFKIEGNDLRFGLGGIKGISENTISKVKDFCKEYANKFEIFIAAKQAGLGIGHLSALIQAGTLDNYGVSRSKLVLEAQVWNILTAREIPMVITHGPQFHFDLFATIKHVATLKNDRGTLFISASRLETIRGKFKLYKAIYDKNKSNEEFANWFYEKTLLGYSYNTTLHKIFSQHISGLRPIKEILDDVDEIKVRFIGEIEAVSKKVSTNKNEYLDIRIVDEFGNRLKAMLFSRNFDRNLEINNEKELEKGNIVTVEGNKKEGYAIFANSVIIQDWRIYMKLSEVEKEIAVEEDNKEAEI